MAFVGAALVFLATIGMLTLLSVYSIAGTTQTIVTQHNTDLTNLKNDVHSVDGFGAGLEWQNARICGAIHIDCTISPPGPPPRG